jgi:hypothetical protein
VLLFLLKQQLAVDLAHFLQELRLRRRQPVRQLEVYLGLAILRPMPQPAVPTPNFGGAAEKCVLVCLTESD